MLRSLLTALALAAAVLGCSAREVEEEGESRRHLAAQWCEDWCEFWYDCEPAYEGRRTDECQESCEADEAWDWTDECGDLRWAYRECKDTKTCEDFLAAADDPMATPPCQEHLTEFVRQGCMYECSTRRRS